MHDLYDLSKAGSVRETSKAVSRVVGIGALSVLQDCQAETLVTVGRGRELVEKSNPLLKQREGNTGFSNRR